MLEKNQEIKETLWKKGEISLVVFPGIMGSPAYFSPLIPHFKRLNEREEDGETLVPNLLTVFGITDDRLKINTKEVSDFFNGGEIPSVVSIKELARNFVSQMLKKKFSGPCFLLGWSMGGCIAREVYVELERLKRSPEKKVSKKATLINPYVILIDTVNPSVLQKEKIDSTIDSVFQVINDVVENLEMGPMVKNLLKVNRDKIAVEEVSDIDQLIVKLGTYYRQYNDTRNGQASIRSLIYLFEKVFFPNIKALYQYNPLSKDSVPMTIISAQSTVEACGGDRRLGWSHGKCEEIEGSDHYGLFRNYSENLFGKISSEINDVMRSRVFERVRQEMVDGVLYALKGIKEISLPEEEVPLYVNKMILDLSLQTMTSVLQRLQGLSVSVSKQQPAQVPSLLPPPSRIKSPPIEEAIESPKQVVDSVKFLEQKDGDGFSKYASCPDLASVFNRPT